jgi:uncharacterized membrane protein
MKIFILSFFISTQLLANTQFSLSKLGLEYNADTISEKKEEQLLEKRDSRLKMHKHMGYLTIALMTATVIAGASGGKKVKARTAGSRGYFSPQDAEDMKTHVALAMLTSVSHLVTGYMAMSAPKSSDFIYEDKRRWHKNLAYFHYPAMILGPIMGLMQYQKMKKGEHRGGFTRMHRPLMYATYGASILAASLMTFDF